ncbi:MAG: hypothetical protein M3357_16320 [Actinomycetota bacterium]|nr:hypothetical protein [Actinomycetota bacterium]
MLAELAADLFLLDGRKARRASFRQAASWSIIWIPHCLVVQRGAVVVPGPGQGREIINQKSIEFLLLSHREALGGG